MALFLYKVALRNIRSALVSLFALWTSFSMSGRSSLAFSWVVLIRSCSTSWVAKFLRICLVMKDVNLPEKRLSVLSISIEFSKDVFVPHFCN